MAVSKISGVRLAGVASAVPDRKCPVSEYAAAFGAEEVKKISDSTGVVDRYVVPPGMTTSDLCYAAAEKLLADTGWERSTVDALVFVSQTMDYELPATACVLQKRLKLPKSCAAFDVQLGCSGYVYGAWLAASLIAGGGLGRVLLLAGDTSSGNLSPRDRSVALLFGDAGTATALDRAAGAPPMTFVLGTDGGGRDHLVIPARGFRTPSTAATRERTEREGGNFRAEDDLYMNGAEVFTFTLREVPPLMRALFVESGWSAETTDSFVLHQANKFMLDYLAKRMKLPTEKVPLVLAKWGNTSSASIPLAMTDALGARLRERPMRLVLAGFGVGYSWGAMTVECGPMAVPPVVFVPESGINAGWEAVA